MKPIEKHEGALNDVREFFNQKVKKFGPTPQAADYNSIESQEIRFKQLIKIVNTKNKFSLIDYGCGYGELIHYIHKLGCVCSYLGFDISEEMIKHAMQNKPKSTDWKFTTDISDLREADYTVASGIFNIIFGEKASWESIILETLNNFAKYSRNGFSFNMLTSYSDKEYMRPDLFYADPLYYFDYCKKNFSRNVSLLHDYELYDFTILVRL